MTLLEELTAILCGAAIWWALTALFFLALP